MRGQRPAHELTQPHGRDLLARWVDRREVGRPARLADVVALDVEPVPAELAAQAHLDAGRQLLEEPRRVEERRADPLATVGTHRRGDECPSPAQRSRAGVHYSTFDRDLALGEAELRDRTLLGRALVAARRVLEQVAHRRDAEAAQPLRERRADAGQRAHVECVETVRRRPAARPGPAILDRTREARVHWGPPRPPARAKWPGRTERRWLTRPGTRRTRPSPGLRACRPRPRASWRSRPAHAAARARRARAAPPTAPVQPRARS